MEFGVFAQLFVPKFERDQDPNAEHKRIMRNVEIAQALEDLEHGKLNRGVLAVSP